jgi:hypothetical protein
MANFKDQLSDLTQSLSAARKVDSLALNEMMSGFSASHALMAKMQRHSLSQNRIARSELVRSIQNSYRSNFLSAGKDFRHHLSSSVKRINLFVSEMRSTCLNERIKSSKLIAEKYRTINKTRIAWNHERIKNVRLMLTELGASRQAAASLYAQERQDFVNEIKANSQMLLTEFVNAQNEVAVQIKLAASSERAILSEYVASLRAGETPITGGVYETEQSEKSQQDAVGGALKANTSSDDTQSKTSALSSVGLAVAETHKSEIKEESKEDSKEVGDTTETADFSESNNDSSDLSALQKTKAWRKMSDDDKVLHLVEKSPAGISVVDICEQSSLHAAVVGKVLKKLFSSGSVSRDDDAKIYFPA